MKKKLGLKDGMVYTVDATGIALDEIKKPIPNVPMIGALLKVTGLADIEDMSAIVAKKFRDSYTDEIVEGNIKAMKRAHEEVKGEK
jgi:pyruvate ferredoxin oxidoreductase gamma subunit